MSPLDSALTNQPLDPSGRKNIAIIGSGITGLSAAWLLNQHHNVSVFEANDYIGGHSHTVDVEVDGRSVAVDTGFIVYNPQNYPNLSALFKHLDVPTHATDMSFAVSLDQQGYEYSGGDGGGLFAQPTNVFKPRFWSMINSLLRFYRNTDHYVKLATLENITLRKLLEKEGYSMAFVRDHLAPMGAAIWSSDCEDILDYPALSFLKFFQNHGLTQLTDRPQWRTVVGGSREYVRRLIEDFNHKIMLNSPVEKLVKAQHGYALQSGDTTLQFDEVLFACHSDQTAKILQNSGIKSPQLELLKNIKYRPNEVILHSDTRLMPKRKRAWASWNYIERDEAHKKDPAVTYWMNRLQHIYTATPLLVTLNPQKNNPLDVRDDHILGRYEYDHPVFDLAALKAKKALWEQQGFDGLWYGGAWMGDGFHEDGIQAGLALAELIGGYRRPWNKPDQNARIGMADLITLERMSLAS